MMNTEAPHTNKGISHQLYRDVVLLGAIMFCGIAHSSDFATKATLLPAQVRQLVLDKHLPHLKPFQPCIIAAASRSKIPEMLLLSILYQEGGRPGMASKNKNRTNDYGVSQINDVRKNEISKIGLSLKDVQDSGCKSVIAMTYLLRNEHEKAKGDLWEAVGNYHYSRKGPNPAHHYKYIRGVHDKWNRMYSTVAIAILNGEIQIESGLEEK